MAFRLLEKGVFTVNERLPEGFASIDHGSKIRFHKTDLDLVGIEGAAVVTDQLAMRIAFRKPRPNEGRQAYRVSPVFWGPVKKQNKKPTGHSCILIKRALDELRVDSATAAGRYQIMTKEDLLIVTLTDMERSKPNPDDEESDEADE